MEAKVENRIIRYGSHPIAFDLIRSAKRRTLGISVHRDQRVEVRAPKRLKEAEIDQKVEKRAGWILKHQKRFSLLQPSPIKRFVKGETHKYLGKEYRLKLSKSNQNKLIMVKSYLVVENRSTKPSDIQKIIFKWYRDQGKAYFPDRVDINRKRFKNLTIPPFDLKIRRMKSRWGSCSPKRVITLNSRLMEYPVSVIDYVITHEICHLFVPNHGKQFYQLLSKAMPEWKELREMLKGQEGM